MLSVFMLFWKITRLNRKNIWICVLPAGSCLGRRKHDRNYNIKQQMLQTHLWS